MTDNQLRSVTASVKPADQIIPIDKGKAQVKPASSKPTIGADQLNKRPAIADPIKDAESLHKATTGLTTDQETILAVLRKYPDADSRQLLQNLFKARFGQSLESVLNQKLHLTYRTRALTLLKSGQDPSNASPWAYRAEGVRNTLDNTGTTMIQHPILTTAGMGALFVAARKAPSVMAAAGYALIGTAALSVVKSEWDAHRTQSPETRRDKLIKSGESTADLALNLPSANQAGLRLIKGSLSTAGKTWEAASSTRFLPKVAETLKAAATYQLPKIRTIPPPLKGTLPQTATGPQKLLNQRLLAISHDLLGYFKQVEGTLSIGQRDALSTLLNTPEFQSLPITEQQVHLQKLLGPAWPTLKQAIGQTPQSFADFKDAAKIWGLLGADRQKDLMTLLKTTNFDDLKPEEQFAKLLTVLGPAHTKLGQILATRPGLSPAMLEALKPLQSDLPPMTDAQTRQRMVSSGLVGRYHLGKVLGVASIGQVNLATQTSTGKQVVIKFLKPGVSPEGIKSEFQLLHKYLDVLANDLPAQESKQFVTMLKEFESGILDEIDMSREANNMATFAQTFKQQTSFSGIQLIELGKDKRAIVMSLAKGIDFKDLKQGDPEVARQAGVTYLRSFAHQAFTQGKYHADPHPGNVKYDPQTGKVVFMDMGAVADISPTQRLHIQKLILFLLARDPAKIAEHVMSKATITSGTPAEARTRYIKALTDYFNGPNYQIGRLEPNLRAVEELAKASGIQPESQGFWLIKSFLTADGVYKDLTGEANALREALPSVLNGLLHSFKENPKSMGSTLKDVAHVLGTNSANLVDSLYKLNILSPGMFDRYPADFLTALQATLKAERAKTTTP